MLYAILNLFFTVIIVVLLIRYFIEPYRFYGFGPILTGIITLTERLLRPIRSLVPGESLRIQDQMPLFAIVVVLILRGFVIWIIGSRGVYSLPIPYTGNIFSSFIIAMSISFTQGIILVAQLLIAILFASLMITRRGISLYGNAGFTCFRDKTFTLFQYAKRVVNTDDLLPLFLVNSITILLCAGLLSAATSLSFLVGPDAILRAFLLTMLEVIVGLLNIYWFILLIAIIASWLHADQFSILVQVIRAMSDPYLDLFRRLMPWARIDFIDLSPIFGFILLMVVTMFLQRIMYTAAYAM